MERSALNFEIFSSLVSPNELGEKGNCQVGKCLIHRTTKLSIQQYLDRVKILTDNNGD